MVDDPNGVRQKTTYYFSSETHCVYYPATHWLGDVLGSVLFTYPTPMRRPSINLLLYNRLIVSGLIYYP
jgi:hypothetical protein